MSKVFTSDLHFFHRNICKFTDRPWIAEENTEKLIDLWNDNVSKGDEVWHLGDFAFVKNNKSGRERVSDILDQLNGQKRFILGNHDPAELYYDLQESRNDIIYVDRLAEIYIRDGDERVRIVMCHYPMTTWNQSHRGSIQLHGHEHGWMHNKGKSIDVALDGANERLGEHRFWTESDIISYASNLEIFNPSEKEKP